MPRIIFKCRYLKNAAAHAENLVTYIATRDGVEKLPAWMRYRPATGKQMLLVSDILEQFPDSTGLFEYEDFLAKPTMENATEFISAALDQNLDQLSHKEVYVNYIATRPHAERLDTHGLFSDENVPLILARTVQEVAAHTGNIWTPIISLRREDAARLGYDNAAAWMALLRKQRNVFAQQMKIAPENLRWYAAYHDEGHHPHCHMIVYSVYPREGFVTRPAIKAMRSSLARDIFQQDLLQIYTEQNKRRNTLTAQSRDTLQELLAQMQVSACDNPILEELLTQLAERLRHTTGKKQYGYLKAPLRELVNRIVDELAKEERVAAAYAQWQELRNEVLRTYRDELPPPLPLSQQKEFKQIRNMVIAEAVRLGNQEFTFEGDDQAEPSPNDESIMDETFIPEDMKRMLDAVTNEELTEEADDLRSGPDNNQDSQSATGHSGSEDTASSCEKPHIVWNSRYKQAQAFLYGSDLLEPYFGQALDLFLIEAEDGNALAMHDLGRMRTGTKKDVDEAIRYLEKSARLGNVHAQYTLGKIYLEPDSGHFNAEKAVQWLTKSAGNGNTPAQYALGKLYLQGDVIPKDMDAALKWLTKSADLGNQFAQYALGRLYLFREVVPKNISRALELFQKSAEQGNQYAQYQLGKLYLKGEDVPKDMETAIGWLTASAEQDNQYAQYQLGKLYLKGKDIPKDVEAAIRWLTASAEQGSQYAQYALGKLYLLGRDISRDREAAVRWLTLSAWQGNTYAQFFLDHLDSFREPSLFLAATRLLHYISRIFDEEARRLSRAPGMQTESKLRQKLRQKKIAQGHAPDDHEQKFTTY